MFQPALGGLLQSYGGHMVVECNDIKIRACAYIHVRALMDDMEVQFVRLYMELRP